MLRNALIIGIILCVVIGFKINPECDTHQQLSMTYEGMDRIAYLHIPFQFCNATNFEDYVHSHKIVNELPFNTSQHQLAIPTLVAFHCVGCNPLWELNKWNTYCNTYGCILVVPKGGAIREKPSWNANDCCDPAVDKDTDDIGFIHVLLSKIFAHIPLVFPYISLSFSTVFMTGFSNGAFMVDKLGWNSVGNLFPSILAISPMAGYIYNYQQYVKHHTNEIEHSPMAVWLHHSATDELVHIDGCCSTKPCKAKIGIHAEECVSVEQQWVNWMKWNGCKVNKYNITFHNIARTIGNAKHGYSCAYATKSEHECLAGTRLCIHEHTRHAQWAKGFVLAEEVILFFLEVLCERNDGIWNGKERDCACDGENVGRYCETLLSHMNIEWDKLNMKREYLVKQEKEYGEMDEYLQLNKHKYVKAKKPLLSQWENREIPPNNDHMISGRVVDVVSESGRKYWDIARFGMGIGAFVLGTMLCKISYRKYQNIQRIRYKLVTQNDIDADDDCSDDSMHSHTNASPAIIRNRNHY